MKHFALKIRILQKSIDRLIGSLTADSAQYIVPLKRMLQ